VPGVLQIETAVIPNQNQYEFYVPIDEKTHMYWQVLGKTCHSEAEAEQHREMVDDVWTEL
jgi:carbazole 1,9a-dioxygenase terminal dioxygenase component